MITIVAPLLFLATAALLGIGALMLSRAPSAGDSRPLGGLARAEDNAELRAQLAQAGMSSPSALVIFGRVKMIAGLAGALLGSTVSLLAFADHPNLPMLAAIFGVGSGLLCWFLPTMWIDRRRQAWRKRVARGVPDALDFMQVCIEAGQSVDLAVMRVTHELRELHPDLAQRFAALTEALAAGASRQSAFMQLAEDCGNDDLRQFATMMLQSSSMGAPITNTLRIFTADLRDQRIRRTEARANVLPTKMTLGSMLFTVPPLLLTLLAPSVARILQAF